MNQTYKDSLVEFFGYARMTDGHACPTTQWTCLGHINDENPTQDQTDQTATSDNTSDGSQCEGCDRDVVNNYNQFTSASMDIYMN